MTDDVSRSSILGVALVALSSGCYQHHGLEPGEAGAPMAMDAGRPVDASVPRWDAAVRDAGALDAGLDVGVFDADVLDAALLDASRRDGGRSDGGLDAGWDAGPDATVWLDGGACDPGADGGFTVSPHTIDRSEVTGSSRYAESVGLIFAWGSGWHYLSDGTSWRTGAGGHSYGTARLVRVERVGTSLRYHLRPDGRLLERTDYDSGDHSAHYALDAVADLVLVAEEGGTVGVIEGEARIGFDSPANYRDTRFHPLSAPPCSIVSFVATMHVPSTVRYTETLFEDGPFNYAWSVTIDFTAPRF